MSLIPRDTHFFEMFNELASKLQQSAALLDQLFGDPSRTDHFASEIKRIEHEADVLTHEVHQRINTSFVTPFDREDIYELVTHLDDVIDLLDGTARRAVMFNIGTTREPAQRLTGVLVRAADELHTAVGAMRKKPKVVTERARAVKLLEEEGDAIYHEAVGALFHAEKPDPIEVMKWKELYDTLEHALDMCQGVANTLESIAIKHS